jgi:TRAP transporter 4TM/12TM fusion protein
VLVLEAARRTGGLPYFLVCVLIGLYPIVADKMPGVLYGKGFSLSNLVGSYAFTPWYGVAGLPSKVMVDILLGFLIFAGALIATGAGKFFLDFAFAIFGQHRGGPAKVAVVGSAFFGSLSGSAIANVVGTGSVTIPAMKRIGFTPVYAAAIEACASTGGILMPPVMGAVAFVMAELLSIPYVTIVAAAAIPAILYFACLLVQVDAYAARTGMKGFPREQVPSLGQVLKEGWHFMFALLFLIWGLLYMRWEAMTPYYTTVLLVVLCMFRKQTRLNLRRFINVIEEVGRLVTETGGLLFPIAFVIGGFAFPGTAFSFTSGLISLAGGNGFLILLFGAAACYILGTMGMITPAYIFLAVTMAPAPIKMGFNVLASHLFIIYYAMLACITPPVAVAAFVAAGIAGAPAMRTALRSMRLGFVIYFIPFFFVYNPALVLQGPLLEILHATLSCALGLVLIAAGIEGYLLGVGKPTGWTRPLLIIAGFLLGYPEGKTDILGVILGIIIIVILLVGKKSQQSQEGAQPSG